MAPKKTSVITVDISSGKVSGQIINYTTMDVNTATLSFQIMKQSIKYPLTDVTAKVFLNMEDGSQFVEDCDIVDSVNGVVQYTLKSNEIKHSGRVDGEFYLIYSDSSVGSFTFTFYIKKSAIDTISVPAQEVAISDIETFKASLEAKLDDTQATLTSVQQQVTNAQTQADNITNLINQNQVAKQSDLNATNASLATKANQSALDTTNANVASNTTALAAMTTQLTDIVKVNAHSLGAKGDGTTNDTIALQNAFTAMKSGDTFILPYGTYKIDNRVTISASNCTFYFYGTFKMAGGIQTPYGLITISGSNNKFYNLSIDGNKSDPTVVDEQSFGTTAILVIGAGASNLYFNNTNLSNSMYSCCIFNGNSSNVVFDGGTISNIGEHAFYVSGGNNTEITFKNLTCQNIGLKGASYDPNHEGYFIKSKNNAYGNNSNFHVYNIKFNQTIAPDYGAFFMNVQDLTYCDVDTIFWSGMVDGLTGNSSTGTVRISNLDNTASAATHGNIFFANNMTASDITIRDSRIGGYQSNLNVCHHFHNCRIIVSPSGCPLADVSAWTQYWDLNFENCTFVFSTGILSYPTVNQNVHFRNCDYITTSATTVSNGCMTFGGTSFNASYNVKIVGGKFNVPNYSYAVFGLNNANVELMNLTSNVFVKGSFGVLTLINIRLGKIPAFPSPTTYVNLIAKNVYYNGLDYTEYKTTMTIASAGTSSPTTNIQFSLLRAVTLADVILSPQGDTGGIRYYPTLSNNLLSVSCTPATSSAVTFNVLVKVNS
jgi:hypothetical protein